MPRGMIETLCTDVGAGQRHGHQRVPHLVMRDDAAFLRVEDALALLQPGDDALHRAGEIVHGDVVGAPARGDQRRLVDEVGEIGAGEAGGQRGDLLGIDVGCQRVALADAP